MENKLTWQIIIIRFMVGAVFLSEGVQKFIFSDSLGVGRFSQIGIPFPEVLAPFVGMVEILFGFFIIIGFLSRISCIPLLFVILTAILTTKIPIFLSQGFWLMAHEARTNYCMFLGLVFLLTVGGGSLSVDSMIKK